MILPLAKFGTAAQVVTMKPSVEKRDARCQLVCHTQGQRNALISVRLKNK